MKSETPKVFLSYNRADEAWKDLQQQQLEVLQWENQLEVWQDRRIGAGDAWLAKIEKAMDEAQVAIFLVSSGFLTSEFIREIEVPRLLERWKEGLVVIPVIVRDCPWRKVPWLAGIQCRPGDGEALALMDEPVAEAALARLAEEIADLFGDGAESPTTGRSQSADAPSRLSGVSEPRISIARLPATGEHFVAREDELARLDAAWNDPATNVISFVAMGGTGKSALINHWLDSVQCDCWRGAERVLGWSFYSQGHRLDCGVERGVHRVCSEMAGLPRRTD